MPLSCCLVCSWIMPAIASEPPEGISTVVSARRVLIDGMVNEVVWLAPTDCARVSWLSVESSETSVMTLRLMRPSDRTTGVKFRPTPNFFHWIWYWQFPTAPVVVAVAGVAGRDREFAAGQEVGALARDRGQVRLGQRADDAGALHRAQRGADRLPGRR